MKKTKISDFIIIFIAVFTILLFVGVVYAWPLWGGTKDDGFPIDNGETRDVYYGAANSCSKVTNNSGKNIFVPTRTDSEWTSFSNNLPAGVNLASCCVSHDHKGCVGNALYWYDSCNNQEDLDQNCTASQTCHNGACCDCGPASGSGTEICGGNYICVCNGCGYNCSVFCPFGCSGGACNSSPPVCVPPGSNCSDNSQCSGAACGFGGHTIQCGWIQNSCSVWVKTCHCI